MQTLDSQAKPTTINLVNPSPSSFKDLFVELGNGYFLDNRTGMVVYQDQKEKQ